MDYEQIAIWHTVIKDDGYVVPHVTKIDIERKHGLYSYFYPPRIGIDFFDADQDPTSEKPQGYIPNLELGDVARIVRMLEIMPTKRTKLEIGLAFEKELERRVTVRVRASEVSLSYHAKHRGRDIDFECGFSKHGLREFISALKEALLQYIRLILEYVVLRKIDPANISES